VAIDIDVVRRNTPGCAFVNHLNNAGASLQPSIVVDTVVDYIQAEALHGGYETATERADELDSVYDRADAFLGGGPENWAFVESATRAWNAAFSSFRFERGDRILTTRAEYLSNMGGLLRAQEIQGIEIHIVPDDEFGQVDVAALESMLDERTRLVSLTHVPTQGGLINPAAEVGRLLRDTPIIYQLDACQSVGQIPVNVEEIGCDILSFTGRKFVRGPRATGMVWASRTAVAEMGNPAGVDGRGADWDEPFAITPFDSARRFEPFEFFYAGKVGLAAALEYAAELGIDEVVSRNRELAGRLRDGLSELSGVMVRDKGREMSAMVTFTVADHDPHALQRDFRARRINVSTSGPGSARLDYPERGLGAVVRASVHYYNTEAEIDELIAAVGDLRP
jgi:selenocysteine lyase/cysteine desulfurase